MNVFKPLELTNIYKDSNLAGFFFRAVNQDDCNYILQILKALSFNKITNFDSFITHKNRNGDCVREIFYENEFSEGIEWLERYNYNKGYLELLTEQDSYSSSEESSDSVTENTEKERKN